MRSTRASLAVLMALGLCAAMPGTAEAAAPAVSKAAVVKALLTTKDLQEGWAKDRRSTTPEESVVTGCDIPEGKAAGTKVDVEVSFTYDNSAFIDEEIISFGTVAQAHADFVKGAAAYARCRSLTIDGIPMTIARLGGRKVGDESALFRMTGKVQTSLGKASLTSYLAVSRYGRHEVAVITTQVVKDKAAIRKAAVENVTYAEAKVADLLPR